MEKPFTWIVRYDVHPDWVADGFHLSDERALEMLGRDLNMACMSTELSACVLVAPKASRIATEQGYGKSEGKSIAAQIKADSPSAYGRNHTASIEKTLTDAIALLDSVAFVRSENDGTAKVLSQLRHAQKVLRGED